MPKATNLTVKNGAGVDKTFTLISPAAGDGSQAQWLLKEGPITTVMPFFSAQADRKPTARGLKTKLYVPSSYMDTVTGKTLVGSRAEINISVAVPNDFPESLKDDFAAYAVGVVNTDLVRSLIRDAVSAT